MKQCRVLFVDMECKGIFSLFQKSNYIVGLNIYYTLYIKGKNYGHKRNSVCD